MAAWLSSTVISHHSLLPHIPSVHLSSVNNSPHLGIAPQSLSSSSQLLHLLGDLLPCLGYIGLWQGLLILIAFRLSQISCFTLSLKYFSSDSENCPDVEIRNLLQFPHPPRAGPVLVPLLFPPSISFILPSFAWFCIFFSVGLILLSTLSWCAHTCVSENIFLMYPWRKM